MTDTYTHSSQVIRDQPVIPDDLRPDPPAGWTKPTRRADYSDQPWIAHGTQRGYGQNCSCEPCRQANRRAQLYFALRKIERDGGEVSPVVVNSAPRGPAGSIRLRIADVCAELVMSYAPDLYIEVLRTTDTYDEAVQTIVELIHDETPDVYADIERQVAWERAYPPRPLAPLTTDADEPVIPMWPDAGRLLGMTRERTLEAVQRRELPIVLVDGELCVLAREVAARLTPAEQSDDTAPPAHDIDTLRGSQLALDDEDVAAIAVPLWPDAGRQLGLSRSATYKRADDGALLVCEIDGKRMVTLAEIERQRQAAS